MNEKETEKIFPSAYLLLTVKLESRSRAFVLFYALRSPISQVFYAFAHQLETFSLLSHLHSFLFAIRLVIRFYDSESLKVVATNDCLIS